MPAIGARRIVLGGRVHDVVRADHDRDIGRREVVVDLVHLQDDVVGDVRLGEQHVHVARQAAGDRVDREPHVDAVARAAPRSSSRTACCARATAMP